MSGYANRVITLRYPELSEDPENDPIWAVIRNPMTMDPRELLSAYGNDDPGNDGSAAAREGHQQTLDRIIAKLMIAARAYDATVEPEYDLLTGEVTGNADQPLLPPTPWDAAVAAKLPTRIRTEISEKFSAAVNPQAGPTQKTSSGPPSPSTTALGAETQSPPS